MTADIPAGIGYLAAGLALAAAEIALVRNRHRFARWQIDRYVLAADRAPRGLRWIHFHWLDERWHDEDFRDKQLVWSWLPPALALPVFAAALIGSAIAEFAR